MPTRQDLVNAARAWIDTPHVHQARSLGVGVDCVGIGVCGGRAVGLDVADYRQYSERPNPEELLEWVGRSCDRLPDGTEPQLGYLMLFWFVNHAPQHLGLMSESGHFIHTWKSAGKVLEQPLSKAWRNRLHSVWSLRGVV